MPDFNTAKTNDINTPILSARNIYFSYPFSTGEDSFSLSVDGLDIYPGERIAFIGPNGAGKTTFLRILGLLQQPERSSLIFNGIEIKNKPQQLQYHRATAFVPQKTVLYCGSVKENIAIGLLIRGEDRTVCGQKVAEMLKAFRIEHLANRPVSQISGGEARRVMLSRALVIKPQILFLDEPFADLDEPVRLELIEDLLPVLSQMGCAIVFVTHNQDETYQLAERFMVMIKGQIIQSGTAHEVFSQPINQAVAEFIGTRNILPARVTDPTSPSEVPPTAGPRTGSQDELVSISLVNSQGKDCANLSVAGPKPKTDKVVACIQPESIVISITPETHASSRNTFPGVIKRIIPSRHFSFLEVDCGVLITASVTNESIKELNLASGKNIQLLIKATAIRLLEK